MVVIGVAVAMVAKTKMADFVTTTTTAVAIVMAARIIGLEAAYWGQKHWALLG